jgi:hypothetical protein
MSKVIEIVVIGATGSGKSHVLALIDKALRDGYGPHAQVACREISLEIGLGKPSPRPSDDTIFNLREQGTASGGDQSMAGLKIEVDTSGVDLALEKLDALGRDYWLRNISSGTASVEAAQGFTTGRAIDPLESAIESTARVMRDERDRAVGLLLTTLTGGTLKRFGDHLDDLLALQIKQLSEPVRIECPQVGDVSFTELTSGRQ